MMNDLSWSVDAALFWFDSEFEIITTTDGTNGSFKFDVEVTNAQPVSETKQRRFEERREQPELPWGFGEFNIQVNIKSIFIDIHWAIAVDTILT